MKRLFIFILTIFITHYSFCQKGAIKGKLIDFESGQPIVEAPIILYGSTLGTRSDSAGQFVFDKLKLVNIELIVHGQTVLIFDTGEETAQNNNYYTLILRDINLSKENMIVDLGILYMVNLDHEEKFNELPCKEINDKFYSYKLVDGAERYIDGKMGLIDFTIPSENCINK